MTLQIGIVGADSLLGKELGEVLSTTTPAWGAYRLRLLAASGETKGKGGERRMVAFADEAALLDPLTEASLADLDLVFFAGAAEQTRTYVPMVTARDALAVDLTSAWSDPAAGRVIRVPHPAAQALAALLPAAAAGGEVFAAAGIFEPASERGMPGIQELQAQSLQLLALASIPVATFGTQIAFNLKSQLPPEVQPSLPGIEAVIAADLRALAAGPAGVPRFPLPALRLVQAPLFHAYLISLMLHFPAGVNVSALTQALRAAPIHFQEDLADQPDALSAAGESEVQVGAIHADPLRPDSVWLYASLDNLRLRAATAVALATAALPRLHASR